MKNIREKSFRYLICLSFFLLTITVEGRVENAFAKDLFVDSGQALGSSRSGGGVPMEDLDGDGDLDVFVANYIDPDRVWLNAWFYPYAIIWKAALALLYRGQTAPV